MSRDIRYDTEIYDGCLLCDMLTFHI